MFTSRAEYRTLLRQENADERLTPVSHKLGLASDNRLKAMEEKREKREKLIRFLKQQSYRPDNVNTLLVNKGQARVKQPDKYAKLLARPSIDRFDLALLDHIPEYIEAQNITADVFEQAEIEIKYSGYIEKEKRNADKLKRLENIKIPKAFDYEALASLSFEAKEKLNKIRPGTLAQASRISGINPSDISVLLVAMGR